MLNPKQQEAVANITGPLLIIAGAGSGKTHTLTERIAHMVKDSGIRPDSILAVTFTNKAAAEMRKRIGEKLGVEAENINPFRNKGLPLVGTFHSAGVYFLRFFADRIGYEKNFVIYDEDDKSKLVKGIIHDKNIDNENITPKIVMYEISHSKNNGITASLYSNYVDSFIKEKIYEIYTEYEKRMKQSNAMDFDDILIKTLELLHNKEVLEIFQNKYEYFLVDEYQDTNEIQYQIVKILSSKTRNLCVVGDDWQGIYSWRGANIKNILHFEKDYPEARTIKLEQNYRSTKNIINAANTVIKHNKEALDKTLWTDNETGEKIKVIETVDEKDEAAEIASLISDKGNYENWAILYRTNGQSRAIEEGLIRRGIPYTIYGGIKFYERKEVKDILAYLRIIANKFDNLSLKRAINIPSRKIGDKSVEILEHYASNYSLQMLEVLENVQEISEIGPQARNSMNNFYKLYLELCSFAGENSPNKLINYVIESINYIDYLKNSYTKGDFDTKIENLEEFENMASRYDGLDYSEGLQMFLEEIALLTDQDRDNSGSKGVLLMTVHMSKGLEFENVIIAGCEEGLFPHSRSLEEPKEMEEERRLMYVAITRAKNNLYITRAHERYYFGNYSSNPQSRFLREIPTEFKNEIGSTKPSKQDFIFSSLKGSSGSGFSFGSSLPSSTPKKETVSNNVSDFKMLDKVSHPQFGNGTIISIDGDLGQIVFEGFGVKKMSLKIAPIRKI
ncbi:MAG: 3'-5' exonuclease [Candidatus Gracilibacteria bacterium]|nr:3'-5' exonuclease [Candidatus Gracilibacteria bacterium]MDD3120052.1 3'-5' exonuclease [Candidatus Gracilibacteria bacterium]MDD4530265.1 3'-5' exonuclease [Candidatus Gracilibacteria bacterium]